MPEKITARRIEALQPPAKGRIEVRDIVARGLTFRLTAAGSRTWSVYVKVNGRDRRFPVGDYPAIGLAEARERAGQAAGRGREPGRDPIAERRKAAADHAAAAALTESEGPRHLPPAPSRAAEGRQGAWPVCSTPRSHGARARGRSPSSPRADLQAIDRRQGRHGGPCRGQPPQVRPSPTSPTGRANAATSPRGDRRGPRQGDQGAVPRARAFAGRTWRDLEGNLPVRTLPMAPSSAC